MHNRTFDEDEIAQADEARRKAQSLTNGDDKNGGDDHGVGDEEETVDLLLLDPKEWKVQSRLFSSTAIRDSMLRYGYYGVETRSLQGAWVVASEVQGNARPN